MGKDNCEYRFCLIDYMWYVAERFSEREHNNLDGGMLLFMCWLFVIVMPLGLTLGCLWGPAIATSSLILAFLPSGFCRLRYTPARREALREHYRGMKHPGRRLIEIILIAIALMIAVFALMFHLGFIHWSK